MDISIIDIFSKLSSEIIFFNLFKEDIDKNIINSKWISYLQKGEQEILKQAVSNGYVSSKLNKIFYFPSSNNKYLIAIIGGGSRNDVNLLDLKKNITKSIRFSKQYKYNKLAFYVDCSYFIEQFTESFYIGDYQFSFFKKSNKHNIKSIEMFIDDSNYDKAKDSLNSFRKIKEQFSNSKITNYDKIIFNESIDKFNSLILNRGNVIGNSINFAQDLISYPGNYCTPEKLVGYTKDIVKNTSLKLTVYEKDDLKKMGMGGILSVAKGSDESPKLIVLHHKPKSSKTKLTLVGKGVTFDTGGISIKPSSKMEEMKTDMSGGAVVIAAMYGISKLNIDVEVMGVIPAVENMPSGKALKPGDVIYAMNGKSIEVLNTDAEGRLILADALCYANEQNSSHIIDIATLTGACLVALGETTSGMMTNNQDFANSFMDMCMYSQERVWQLPLFPEYYDQIKSDVADIANIGGRYAGAITAACFLENFVKKTPWIHLDIAGTNWTDKDSFYNKGATGVMVSSFIRYAEYLANGFLDRT